MRKILAAAALLMLLAGPAFALDLQEARQSGVIGEKTDGYVSVLKPSAAASALASDVNAKRRAEYEKISKANSQPVDVVGKVAAEQIIQKLSKGAMFQTPSGGWASR